MLKKKHALGARPQDRLVTLTTSCCDMAIGHLPETVACGLCSCTAIITGVRRLGQACEPGGDAFSEQSILCPPCTYIKLENLMKINIHNTAKKAKRSEMSMALRLHICTKELRFERGCCLAAAADAPIGSALRRPIALSLAARTQYT